MSGALRGARAAQTSHRLDERVDTEGRDPDVARRLRNVRRAVESRGLHQRLVERKVAVRIEGLLEVGGTVERRHPEKRREPVPRVDPLAMFDLLIERQRGTEMGVDAARSLRLALRQAHHPAVVEKSPLRLQRIETGFLDAAWIESRAIGGSGARHWTMRFHIANTSNV